MENNLRKCPQESCPTLAYLLLEDVTFSARTVHSLTDLKYVPENRHANQGRRTAGIECGSRRTGTQSRRNAGEWPGTGIHAAGPCSCGWRLRGLLLHSCLSKTTEWFFFSITYPRFKCIFSIPNTNYKCPVPKLSSWRNSTKAGHCTHLRALVTREGPALPIWPLGWLSLP